MHYFDLPLAEWTDKFLFWVLDRFGLFFDAIGSTVQSMLDSVFEFLAWLPPELIAMAGIALAWRYGGRALAVFAAVGLLVIGAMDLWNEMLQTLVVVLVATGLSIAIGVPLGIAASQFDPLQRALRPVLDLMQTMPSFVYLIPVLMLFGLGQVAAVLATVVFAMPPAVRLTDLGIREVDKALVEAAQAFGSTRGQLLGKVLLPQAKPTVMAGVNQTIMLSLSMAVITAMIGGEGLGGTVLYGISRVAPGIGLEGGVGIVVLAILLDRLSGLAAGRARHQSGTS